MTVDEHRNKINKYKTHWRITLSEMAQKSGLSEGWICRYLRGQHDNPTYRTTQKLDEALKQIIGERQSLQMPGSKDSTDPFSPGGRTHNGLDGLMPAKGSSQARAEDDTNSHDSAV
tara:strand:+ start:278 stop:625 length:348 start_codon:yes stop_codon:yes gene_type:complete